MAVSGWHLMARVAEHLRRQKSSPERRLCSPLSCPTKSTAPPPIASRRNTTESDRSHISLSTWLVPVAWCRDANIERTAARTWSSWKNYTTAFKEPHGHSPNLPVQGRLQGHYMRAILKESLENGHLTFASDIYTLQAFNSESLRLLW
jgi:hypothetical protein